MSTRALTSRRAVLAGTAGATVGLAGCMGMLNTRTRAPVSILAAGSLSYALNNGLQSAATHPLRVEAHGSATVARMVVEKQKTPDIVSIADTALFDGPLHPEWYATFATNALVLAYNSATDGGAAVRDADRWYRPLLSGTVELGRTDPDLDPLGYRTLFLFELASDYYDTDQDLRTVLPTRTQLYPETQLVTKFETGAIDVAVTYRNMAIERGYEYIELPAAINLGDPTYAERYAGTSYDLPSGKTVTGKPIRYGSTIRNRRAAVDQVFETHITGEYLTTAGFSVPSGYPRYTGNVPETVPH